MPAPQGRDATASLMIYPDPVLRQRAAPVARFDDDLRDLVRRMFTVMYEHRGIGLAAPQIGVSSRVFVGPPSFGPL